MKTILIISFLMVSLALFGKDYGFSQADKKVVEKEAGLVPDPVRVKFNSLYEAWKTDWITNPATKASSNTNDARRLKDFQALSGMGKDVIPLVVNQMMNDVNGNLIGLVLYDSLQDNPALKVKTDKEYISEQERIMKTVNVWVNSVKNEK